MATLAKLTDAAIRPAKGKEKPYKLADGGGLHILVTPEGGKYWRYNYRYADKDRTMAFGVYPEVSAKTARALLAAGVDPMAERKQEKHAVRAAAADDFEGIAREMWAKKLASGKSAGNVQEVLGKLEKDVLDPRTAVPAAAVWLQPGPDRLRPVAVARFRRLRGAGCAVDARREIPGVGASPAPRYGL